MGPYVKRFSHERADRRTYTHTQTDGSDFIPSTADAGGNKAEFIKILSSSENKAKCLDPEIICSRGVQLEPFGALISDYKGSNLVALTYEPYLGYN